MNLLLKILLAVLCFYGVQRFCHRQTDGFTPLKIESTVPYEARHVKKASPEILNALDQPYHYLGRGAQAYAFVSEDGRYVIKFFRHRRMHNLLCQAGFLLPSFLRERLEQTAEKRSLKLVKDYKSYELAFEKLRQETGLLYLHLAKTEDLKKRLVLYDKIKVLHELPLDQMEFVVQKRAYLLFPSLENWIKEGNLEEAKKVLTQVVSLLKTRAEKGIFDKDPELKTNFGVCEGKVLQIDIGRFTENELPPDPLEIHRITDDLRKWLHKKDPVLESHLMSEIDG